MTFQTATYTGTGNQTAMTVSPSGNVYVFVKASSADRYDIKFKVDSTGLRRDIKNGDNRKGMTRIIKIDEPAAEINLNISNNASGDIILEVKEY